MEIDVRKHKRILPTGNSTTVRKHTRSLDNPKYNPKPRTPLKPTRGRRLVDYNWKQSKARFPNMNPKGDIDGDGVINKKDCKPFDKNRQGFQHQYSFVGTGSKKIKTVEMPPELFLRTTYGEAQRNKRNKEDKEDYEEYKDFFEEEFENNPEYEKAIIDKIKSDEENVPIPFLEFKDTDWRLKEGGGWEGIERKKVFPAGHEGRHTALAAQRAGLNTIPVTLEYPEDRELSDKYEDLEEIEGKQYNKGEGYRKTISVEEFKD